jgi:hypothetical protein
LLDYAVENVLGSTRGIEYSGDLIEAVIIFSLLPNHFITSQPGLLVYKAPKRPE